MTSRMLLIVQTTALCLLLLWWYGAHIELEAAARNTLLIVLLAPLLWVLALLLLNRPSAGFWTGFVTLLHFCHGVMEAWSSSAGRMPALLEIFLVLGIHAVLLKDGLHARRLRRAAAANTPAADKLQAPPPADRQESNSP